MAPLPQPAHAPSIAPRLGPLLALLSAITSATAVAAAEPVTYHDHIKPLLAVHCYKCHGPDAKKGGLRLDLPQAALAKGKSGAAPAIAPGDAARSELFRRITSHDPDEVMPPEGEPLSAADVARVRAWIDQGARWPDKDDYWAFQSPKPVDPPTIAGAPPPPNPIEAFLEARLVADGIAPAPQADRRTLLRRAYADLLGVPPSPEETDAFLGDASPDAYGRLVDRLLDDPRYGERWARHWLDLARYAESDGFEDDKVRPHAWRYRDYVIRSLNADKPYDRFVQEQIAGDQMWPGDPEALVATGFARLGAWDGMSKVPEQRRQDFLNDATDAVGSVFLGMTVGCARCHDHKYDAISQRDYYALQAFFAGAKRETREFTAASADPPHVIEARRQAQVELARLRGERDAILRGARAQIEWVRREEVDENGKLNITDADVRKAAEAAHPGRLKQLEQELKTWEPVERLNAATVEAVLETDPSAPKTVLLQGGELSRPGAEVPPGFIEAMASTGAARPQIVPPPGDRGTGRRTALARWLTSADHPLTARVWVNRLWQHHFGRGIVATPSDFGRHGQRPSHPHLLDWLARRLVADGWSTKKMHRLMMTSAAYRRSSSALPAATERDPENALLWRANRRRLEAEAIRDSILTASGRLSATRGGPGVYPRLPTGVNVQLPNNDKELSWGTATDDEDRRRTIYVFQRRSLTFPLVEVFDGAPMSQSCPARPQTTVAPQALALFNGEFSRAEARHMADRVRREAGNDQDGQVERAFKIALARPPAAAELAAARAFLARQAEVRRTASTAADADRAALADLCHVVLNTNEFIYTD